MDFTHITIYVKDIQQSLAFYKEAFGLETRFVHESGQYAELETGAVRIGLASENIAEMTLNGQYRPNSLADLPGGFVISLTAEDVPAAFAQATAAGATAVVEPFTQPWGQEIAYVRDIDGVLVELEKWVGQ